MNNLLLKQIIKYTINIMSDTDYREIYIDKVNLVRQKTKIIDGCIKIIKKTNREIVQDKLFNKEVLEYYDFKSKIPKRSYIENTYNTTGEDDDLLKVKKERIKLHIEEFLLIFERVCIINGLNENAQMLRNERVEEMLTSNGGVINKKKRKSNKKKRKSNKKKTKIKQKETKIKK